MIHFIINKKIPGSLKSIIVFSYNSGVRKVCDKGAVTQAMMFGTSQDGSQREMGRIVLSQFR